MVYHSVQRFMSMINGTRGFGICGVAEKHGRKNMAELSCSSFDSQEERKENRRAEEGRTGEGRGREGMGRKGRGGERELRKMELCFQ